MYMHRLGRKLKLPSTIAIKHQIRKLMAYDEIKKVEAEAKAKASEFSHLSQASLGFSLGEASSRLRGQYGVS